MSVKPLGMYRGEITGNEYMVEEHTKLITHRPLVGQATEVEGSPEYKTSCGIDLNRISDDLSKFETFNPSGDGEVIVKV